MDGDYEYVEDEEVPPRPDPDNTEKFFYWFDNFFATNPMAKVYLLCVVNVVFMIIFGVCFHITGSQGGDWAENFWMGFTFAADMAEDDHGGPFPYWKQWLFRVLNFTFSFGGAFVFGLVINFLSSWIDDRVAGLREGKSKVLEQDHTLVLGWNDRLLALLTEICEANRSEGGLPIVVLADRDKVEMDDFLMDALSADDRKGSKIVTRKGDPIESSKLVKVSVEHARSIIVLSEGEDPDEADAQSVRRILALTAGLDALGKRIKTHVVLEIQDIDNAEVAMLGVTTGVPEDVVVPVISHDIIGKLMIQCAREIGLSACFQALMTFEGSECYFSEWNSGCGHVDDGMTGKRFGDVLYRFKDAAVIGVRFANPESPEVLKYNPTARPVMLNPHNDYVMQYNDRILVIAEDNDTYQFGKSNNPIKTPVPPFELPPAEPEKFLLAGWRRDMDDIVRELDNWVPKGSHLTLFNRHPPALQFKKLAQGGLELPGDDSQNFFKTASVMRNIITVELVQGDVTSGKAIERLGPKKRDDDHDDRLPGSRMRIEEYDSVLTLCMDIAYQNGMSADSRVMVSMLVTRYIQTRRGQSKKTLVAEIRDPRTQDLMSFTNCTDSVVGNRIVAMILAQISEDRDNGYVMEDLFSEEGMEMHVKDIRLFVAPDEFLNWWELVDRCTQRNMLPIGWIRKNGDDNTDWTVDLNPENKDEQLRWYGRDSPDGDLLVVISEK